MKTKIKIMETRPGVTDDEIRSEMNFERLLALRGEVVAAQRRAQIKWLMIILVMMIMMAGAGWFFLKDATPEKKEMAGAARVGNTKESVPEIQKDENVSSIDSAVSGKPADQKNKVNEKPARERTPQQTPAAAQGEVREENKLETNDVVYIQAEPTAGYGALYEYFEKELRYPEAAVKDSIQGVITIMFTINTDGHPENIAIRNSLGKVFDDEAIRLIGRMPQWTAATMNGKPVASKISIPLTFRIQKAKSN